MTGDNLRMALEERGGGGGCEVRAQICSEIGQCENTQQQANSRAHRVDQLVAHEQSHNFDGLRSAFGLTGRGCFVNISKNRHRRRASGGGGGGNLLTRALVVNQLTLMTSLSFLFMLVLFAQHQQQQLHVAALKLPSFLASWIPQQQQQTQTQPQVSLGAGQVQDLAAAAELSSDHSSNTLSFAPTNGHRDNAPAPKAKQLTSPIKRPFSNIANKHPIGAHHHLFSALPKSLFGRILSAGAHTGSQSQQQQQQLQEQAGAGLILSPMTRQQQHQLVLAMMANGQKHQAGRQTSGQTAMLWPHVGPLTAPSGGNYSQLADMASNGNKIINGNNQQYQFAMSSLANQNDALAVNSLMQQQQQPITSFRPIAQAAAHQQQVAGAASAQSESPKKHALGYGESDADFVIVNAEHVPDLQRPASVMRHEQQRRPLATTVWPTRHPIEEYREMPAIVIADPDDETVASFNQAALRANQTANGTISGANYSEQTGIDPVKLKPLSGQSNTTIAAGGQTSGSGNRTVPDVTPAPQADGSNSTLSKQPLLADSDQAAAPAFDAQHQNSPSAADSPESYRQESVASAVIVAASSDAPAPAPPAVQQQSEPEPEALESFILGPYKGLSLNDDELASPSAHQFQTQVESFIDHQQPQYSFPSYHMQQQQPMQPMQQQQVVRQQNNNNNNNHQQQQPNPKFGPTHSGGPQNLLGRTSSLIQHARQLIQLPFTHLPQNAHLHQLQQQQQQQQPHNSQFRRPPPIQRRPQQQQQQNVWPSPMYGMPQQPQQQMGFYANFQQQQVAPSMGNPRVNQQNAGYDFAPAQANNQRPPAYFFEGQKLNQPTPPAPGNFQNHGANFNLAVNHGAQMSRPSSVYFVDSSRQQQRQQSPAMVAPMQHGQDSHRQHQLMAAQLNSNQTGGQSLGHFTQQITQLGNNKRKSGLYQIEPPKLESGDKIGQQQLVLSSGDDDSIQQQQQQQQQKIDVQENASDDELGGSGGVGSGGASADDDDDDEQHQQQQDISQQPLEQQQQQQQDNEQRGEQQHQSQQVIAVAEAADQQQQHANGANFSHQTAHHQMAPPIQILQASASFGAAPDFTVSSSSSAAAAANQSQRVQVVQEGRRGQVFNESLGLQQAQQLTVVGQPDQDITAAYEFGQHQAAPEQQQQQQHHHHHQEQANYLDTQVYTLPYTMSMQDQVASFVAEQQQLPPRARLAPVGPYAFQRAAAQQQQHWQMPVTFIRTGQWGESPRQQSLSAPVAPNWANNNRQIFHHYQPVVDQTSNKAAEALAPDAQQLAGQQFAFAVQHQPSQLAAQTLVLGQQQQQQQQEVVESSAPSAGQQQQQQNKKNAVSDEPAASNFNQMASTSTTTPSSRVDDSGFSSQQMAQDFSTSQQSRQEQPANQLADYEQQDRKSQQTASVGAGQTKEVAPRSPSGFCAGRASGLYADVGQRCRAYYQCAPTGHQMFQCNNQTLFNQRTQNCDWWYNVDCGGRLRSPEDFEQASPSSPRSQLVSMDQEMATPTSASATPNSFSSSARDELVAHSQKQQSAQVDLRSYVEPPPSSTLAYNTAPPPVATTQVNVPNADTQPNQQQQQQQHQQFEVQATTATTTSAADARTLSSLEQSSATPTRSAITSDQQQQQQQGQSDEGDQQASAATTASSNQLIEVVNSGQTDENAAQPRVGSTLNDDTPSPTSQATPTLTTTTQQTIATTLATAPMPTTGAQQTTDEQNGVSTTRREQQQQQQPEQRSQNSQVVVATAAAGGKPSARRFIQSEFGGSTKTARAISQQRALRQQQAASTGNLLARLPPLQDEMSQLHAQVEEHHSVRLGSAPDLGGPQDAQPESQQQQQQQIYSTSANQGSISYDPQVGVRDQQTIDLLGQFSPHARMRLEGFSAAASESRHQLGERPEQSSMMSQPIDEQKLTRTLERRFGARLPATPKSL